MLTQFNSSTWREDNIEIESGEVYDLNFIDTKPNMFYIQNSNDDTLRISISNVPTKERYEFSVHPNSSEPIGRPTGTGHLYILNTGNLKAKVKVYSIADRFDMNILKNFVVNLAGVTVEAQEKVSFADGVSLPSGTNNIGVVTLEEKNNEQLKTINETTVASASDIENIKSSVEGIGDNVQLIRENSDSDNINLDAVKTDVADMKENLAFLAGNGVGIMGNVNVDTDSFYKEEIETEDIFGYTLKTGSKISEIIPVETDFLLPFSKDTSDSSKYTETRKLTGLSTFFWFTGAIGQYKTITDQTRTFSEEDVKKISTKKINGTNYFSLKDFFNVLIAKKVNSKTDVVSISYGTNTLQYAEYEKTGEKQHKEISGILHDYKRIKEYFDGFYKAVPRNDAIIFGDGSEKIMDKIDSINVYKNHGTIGVEIQISEDKNNLVAMCCDYDHPITNLEIPVYKITVRGGLFALINDTTAPENQFFNIIGGLY